MFESLFEQSEDAIWLYDPQAGLLVDCNQAAVKLLGAQNKRQFLPARPGDISPPVQPDGLPSADKSPEKVPAVEKQNGHRFEWLIRRLDGSEVPVEVTSTAVVIAGKTIHIVISRDVSERKQTEREWRELNESLERRVNERTAALREANRELQREIAQRTRAEDSLNARIRISTLNTEVALALNAAAGLRPMLQQCTELVVQHLDVAIARVWILNEATQTLELEASAGCDTHLDGSPSRIRVGQDTIGLIAKEKKPLLTNSLETDLRIIDTQWAAREGVVAFAGYPLLLEGRVLGVLAMFGLPVLAEDMLKAAGSVADSIALGIERKRAQTALAESEARFNIAFQASPVFISIFRVSSETYVLANDALLNWLGATREEVLGRTSGQLGMWENPADRAAVWRDLQTVGSIRQKEYRWRNRRGELSTVLLSAERMTIAHEPHVLSLVLDISQRKSAEVEILKALAREKELSQLKSNFVSMVSHEFRTPLGIIQSSAELLHEFLQKMEPQERQTQLESIFRNTRRMAGMMEEILVLSRLDAGKLDFQPATMDLAVFCRRASEDVLSATNRFCPIEMSVARDLPPARADERLLSHILTNLLSNAVKYSEPGVAVRFAVEREGTEALLVIIDKGIGISENDQQMLFSAFHRGANVGSRPGTGLGLLLVKRCVELHHGKVRIQSKIGAGTSVVVRLPLFQGNA